MLLMLFYYHHQQELHDINEINSSKYLYSINLLGKKVNRDVKKQVVLDIYSNGKVVKRFNP